jgi:ribosomal protein S18 acetylase RimI-like enzyme
MSGRPFEILAVTTPDEAKDRLQSLAAEWQEAKEFWPLESCVETMSRKDAILSAAACAIHPRTAEIGYTATSSAENKGQYIGWYLATCQGADCELLFICSAKAQRGQGLGGALLENLILRAKQRLGTEAIFLEVRESNLPAIKLYERYGFVLMSKRPRYYSLGEDALVYQLSLKDPNDQKNQ